MWLMLTACCAVESVVRAPLPCRHQSVAKAIESQRLVADEVVAVANQALVAAVESLGGAKQQLWLFWRDTPSENFMSRCSAREVAIPMPNLPLQ